jgi:PAT family beta-lactamase induction signal transducer AmpG
VMVGRFFQAGILGGGGLGGGGLLLLAKHVSRGTVGLAAAGLIFLPALVALFVEEPEVRRHAETVWGQVKEAGKEFRGTFWHWGALPSLLLLVAPMASGGAITILPTIATDYGVSQDQVAWLNGVAGALLTAAGAMVMMWFPARFDTRIAYPAFGLLNALMLGIMCLGHPRPATYLWGAGLYLFTVGACYALYTALVLKIIGPAGRSGGGRYAMSVSLANIPVAYMPALDGLGAKWFGAKGLPGMDLVLSSVAACGFLTYFLWRRRTGRQTAE